MFVTPVHELDGPRWIVNFPTKQHWRAPSRMEWVVDGLQGPARFLIEQQVKSIAIPPLGAGNGGLEWAEVREQIERTLGDLDIDILVFEPTKQYQTWPSALALKADPARALIAELVRRYWVLGMECSLLEIQNSRGFWSEPSSASTPIPTPWISNSTLTNTARFANRPDHLLNNLDGSYLHCEKRISDAGPMDVIWFDDERKAVVQTYLKTEAKAYSQALEATAALIDGFESPFGMELLATVDWLLAREGVAPNVPALREGLRHWRGGPDAAARKDRLFDDRALGVPWSA